MPRKPHDVWRHFSEVPKGKFKFRRAQCLYCKGESIAMLVRSAMDHLENCSSAHLRVPHWAKPEATATPKPWSESESSGSSVAKSNNAAVIRLLRGGGVEHSMLYRARKWLAADKLKGDCLRVRVDEGDIYCDLCHSSIRITTSSNAFKHTRTECHREALAISVMQAASKQRRQMQALAKMRKSDSCIQSQFTPIMPPIFFPSVVKSDDSSLESANTNSPESVMSQSSATVCLTAVGVCVVAPTSLEARSESVGSSRKRKLSDVKKSEFCESKKVESKNADCAKAKTAQTLKRRKLDLETKRQSLEQATADLAQSKVTCLQFEAYLQGQMQLLATMKSSLYYKQKTVDLLSVQNCEISSEVKKMSSALYTIRANGEVG